MNDYAAALRERQAAYRERYLPSAPDLTPGAAESPQVLSSADARRNILPGIRSRFWNWFESADPRLTLQPDFARLDSVQALTFNLFFPLLLDGVADPRLVDALGIIAGDRFHGHFDAMSDSTAQTGFDFCLEAGSGQAIVFDVKLAAGGFGTCHDAAAAEQLLRECVPVLRPHVDAKWLAPDAAPAHAEILRHLAHLAADETGGLVFILPKANARLTEHDETIKRMVSKDLAPRVAILYLEYLVERLISACADDADMLRHYLELREKYMC